MKGLDSEKSNVGSKPRGGQFFAIDRRTWGAVCDLGRINDAASYLVLAQGTGRNNRETSWSTTSLKSYVGISWERGKLAINNLMAEGFIRNTDTSSEKRPRYELLSWDEIQDGRHRRATSDLSPYQKHLIAEVREGDRQRISKDRRVQLDVLTQKGLLHRRDYDCYSVVDWKSTAPDPIWLPNTLVTGTTRGEDSPVRRLKCAGDIWTLRLLVDLYHIQNLRDDGGVSPLVLREKFDQAVVGEQGLFRIWGFRRVNKMLWWNGPLLAQKRREKEPDKDHPIWDSIQRLGEHGLITFVPHLWDNLPDSGQAEIIHPYGIAGIGGEELEIRVGMAANEAGLAMLSTFKRQKAEADGYECFAPIPRTIPNVHMVGAARLRYRPHTGRTGEWFKELTTGLPEYVARYERLAEQGSCAEYRSA